MGDHKPVVIGIGEVEGVVSGVSSPRFHQKLINLWCVEFKWFLHSNIIVASMLSNINHSFHDLFDKLHEFLSLVFVRKDQLNRIAASKAWVYCYFFSVED